MGIFNPSTRTKIEEDMGLQLERGVELFFQKIETNYHSSYSCVFGVPRPSTFIHLLFFMPVSKWHSSDRKTLNPKQKMWIFF